MCIRDRSWGPPESPSHALVPGSTPSVHNVLAGSKMSPHCSSGTIRVSSSRSHWDFSGESSLVRPQPSTRVTVPGAPEAAAIRIGRWRTGWSSRSNARSPLPRPSSGFSTISVTRAWLPPVVQSWLPTRAVRPSVEIGTTEPSASRRAKQCAAVTTQSRATREPPQRNAPLSWNAVMNS